MPPSGSTGDWDAIVQQIRWSAAIQTPVNCHCQLEDHPVGHIEPVKFVLQYLTMLRMVTVINSCLSLIQVCNNIEHGIVHW